MMPKQPGIPITNVLQGLTLKHKLEYLQIMFIAWLAYVTEWAKCL